jgi:hypothetical protein
MEQAFHCFGLDSVEVVNRDKVAVHVWRIGVMRHIVYVPGMREHQRLSS